MKGYKILNADGRCYPRPITEPDLFKQYTVPGEFEEDVIPVTCQSGMHLSKYIVAAMRYKFYFDKSKFVEVESYGREDILGKMVATDKLRIIRELSLDEVLEEITRELEEGEVTFREFAYAFGSPEELNIFARLTSYNPVKFRERTTVDLEWVANYRKFLE